MRIVTLLTIVGVLATAAPVEAAKSPAPRLVVARAAPLVLKGSHFKPREIVRLVVTTGAGKKARLVRASAAGQFTATFTTISRDRCGDGVTASATGRQGSMAVAKLGPFAECPPAP